LTYHVSLVTKNLLKEGIKVKWIAEHYQWFFSGLGVPIVFGIFTFIGWLFFKKKSGDIINQRQSARDDANQSQVGKIVNHKNSSRK
jgi:hypothetical protein